MRHCRKNNAWWDGAAKSSLVQPEYQVLFQTKPKLVKAWFTYRYRLHRAGL